MGLSETDRTGVDTQGVWYQVGALQLYLMLREPPPPLKNGTGPHFALHVPTESFYEIIGALRERGAEVVREPSLWPQDGIWEAFCLDPDGNMIELTGLLPST